MRSGWRLVVVQVGALTLVSCGGQAAITPSPSPTVDQAKLAQLEAKPLNLPVVPPPGRCPDTLMSSIDSGSGLTSAYGNGPVYGFGGPQTTTTWGDYFEATYLAEPHVTGLVLVRIRDIRSSLAGVFVGSNAAGGVVGTDTIDGKTVEQHAELVFDASHHPSGSGTNQWGVWHVRQGIAASWSGCFGIQVDGTDFSETIVGGA